MEIYQEALKNVSGRNGYSDRSEMKDILYHMVGVSIV